MSKAGGDVAEWHCDANHNFTIQLSGAKEWSVLPAGQPRADGSRGMFDAPRNRAEQLQCAPSTSAAERFSLSPGAVLYVPPGDWHRVVPIEGGSLSVDVRIGHLTAAKWLSEATFATLSLGAMVAAKPSPALASPALASPALSVGPAEGEAKLTSCLSQLSAQLRRCRVPRALPCEHALSDGLNRAASLSFLEAKGFLLAATGPSAKLLSGAGAGVGVCSMMSIGLKRRDAHTMLVSLLAVSSLTNLEYCRFAIVCEAELHTALTELVSKGAATVADLISLCTKPKRLHVMLRCLLHANVLYTLDDDSAAAAAAAEHRLGSQPSRQVPSEHSSKRRRR